MKAKTKKVETEVLHIRWMIRRDMPEVLEAGGNDYTEGDYLRWLRERNVIGIVAEVKGESDDNGKVRGFVIYELNREWLGVVHHGIHASAKNRADVLKNILLKLRSKLHSHRRPRVQFIIQESDLWTLGELRQAGYLATEVLREHFLHDDGIVMEYRLEEGDA